MFRSAACRRRTAGARPIRSRHSSRSSGSTLRPCCSTRGGIRGRPRTSSASRRKRCTERFANSGCVDRTSDESARRMKILVIEDDPTVGQYVKRGLEEQRWGVDLVTNGEEGESTRGRGAVRPRRARHAAAGSIGDGGASRDSCARLRASGARAHGAGRRGCEGGGVSRGRRRLRHEAVRLRGAAGPRRGAEPAHADNVGADAQGGGSLARQEYARRSRAATSRSS